MKSPRWLALGALAIAALCFGSCGKYRASSSTPTFTSSLALDIFNAATETLGSALEDFEGGSGSLDSSTSACNATSSRTADCDFSFTADTTYSGCSLDDGATLSGTERLNFFNINVCNRYVVSGLAKGDVASRSYVNFKRTSGSASTAVSSSSGDVQFTFGASGPDSALVHALLVRGITRTTTQSSTTLEQFYLAAGSGGAMNVTGKRSTGDRTLNGTMALTDQTTSSAPVAYTLTFSNVVWGSSSCCYPTSGTIDQAATGKTAKIVFSSSCGMVTVTDTDGSQRTGVNVSGCE